jgi:hypothetical protein
MEAAAILLIVAIPSPSVLRANACWGHVPTMASIKDDEFLIMLCKFLSSFSEVNSIKEEMKQYFILSHNSIYFCCVY